MTWNLKERFGWRSGSMRGAARFEAVEEPWSLEGAAGIEVDLQRTWSSGVYRPIVRER